MNLAAYIAKRYLFAKKTHNVINIISYVSVAGVALGTLALVVVLSVYNGFDDFVKSLYTSFDSDIRITAVEGKTFDSTIPQLQQVRTLDGVVSYSEVLEDNVLLNYEVSRRINDYDEPPKTKQLPAIMKGVDDSYLQTSDIERLLIAGDFELKKGDIQEAVLGYGIAGSLGVNAGFVTPLQVWAPKRGKKLSLGMNALQHDYLFPSGIFSVDKTIDGKYIFTSLDFARDLLGYTDEVSSIELKVSGTANADKLQKEIEQLLGSSFNVKNRYQQNETLYRVMLSEKFVIYLILILIVTIVSFNIIGSLTMLMVDKKKDIVTLQNIGADIGLIKRIFLFEGWLIAIFGAIVGLLLGLFVCWLQIQFQLVSMPSGFLISAYPVKVQLLDVLLVFGLVILMGYLIARIPVAYLSKRLKA